MCIDNEDALRDIELNQYLDSIDDYYDEDDDTCKKCGNMLYEDEIVVCIECLEEDE